MEKYFAPDDIYPYYASNLVEKSSDDKSYTIVNYWNYQQFSTSAVIDADVPIMHDGNPNLPTKGYKVSIFDICAAMHTNIQCNAATVWFGNYFSTQQIFRLYSSPQIGLQKCEDVLIIAEWDRSLNWYHSGCEEAFAQELNPIWFSKYSADSISGRDIWIMPIKPYFHNLFTNLLITREDSIKQSEKRLLTSHSSPTP